MLVIGKLRECVEGSGQRQVGRCDIMSLTIVFHGSHIERCSYLADGATLQRCGQVGRYLRGFLASSQSTVEVGFGIGTFFLRLFLRHHKVGIAQIFLFKLPTLHDVAKLMEEQVV